MQTHNEDVGANKLGESSLDQWPYVEDGAHFFEVLFIEQ